MSDETTIPSPFYRVSMKALVFDAERRLLVVQEPDGPWEVPGGGWEHGESLEQCLARELDEELGARVRSIDLSTLYPCTGVGASGYHRLKLAVRVVLEDSELTLGDEMQATRYVTSDEFRTLEMRNGEKPMRAHILQTWPAPDDTGV
jgi:8-oxo-dGTP diphosphatase